MTGGKTHHWLHMVGFAALIAVTVWSGSALEFPCLGSIRGEALDQALADLLGSRQ
jgi:hypothetical protein